MFFCDMILLTQLFSRLLSRCPNHRSPTIYTLSVTQAVRLTLTRTSSFIYCGELHVPNGLTATILSLVSMCLRVAASGITTRVDGD